MRWPSGDQRGDEQAKVTKRVAPVAISYTYSPPWRWKELAQYTMRAPSGEMSAITELAQAPSVMVPSRVIALSGAMRRIGRGAGQRAVPHRDGLAPEPHTTGGAADGVVGQHRAITEGRQIDAFVPWIHVPIDDGTDRHGRSQLDRLPARQDHDAPGVSRVDEELDGARESRRWRGDLDAVAPGNRAGDERHAQVPRRVGDAGVHRRPRRRARAGRATPADVHRRLGWTKRIARWCQQDLEAGSRRATRHRHPRSSRCSPRAVPLPRSDHAPRERPRYRL